ncbi:MAG: glycosyltransferase family 4 protein [Pseudomonadota bacterium]
MTRADHILHLQTGGGAFGGIAGYVAALTGSETLKRYRFTVTIGPGEAEVLRASRKYGDAALVPFPPTYSLFSLPKRLVTLRQVLRQSGAKLIHSHALRGGYLCALLNALGGVRFVHTNHGLRFHQKSGRISKAIFRRIERFVIARAERIICIRQSDAALLQHEMPQCAAKCQTIVTRVSPEVPAALPIDLAGPFHLVGVGSLIEVKRVDRFIDWIAALQRAGHACHATWLGDGPLQSRLQAQAAAQDVEINWAGQVDPKTVSTTLHSADAMLLTSEFEVLSLAALEAMGNYTPVVTTDFFGVRDFVRPDETGMILPLDVNPDAAAAALATLLADRPRLAAMGRAARADFEDRFFDHDRMAAEYATLYREVLEAGA